MVSRLRVARTIRSFSAMFQQLKTRFASLTKQFPIATMRRLRRREDGAAAVEFALVAAPFFAMLFAIIETSLIFFAGQTLETATADASRLIMTGQAQTQGYQAADFKNAVCSHVFGLFDCQGKLQVDVTTYGYTDFNSAKAAKPIDNNGNLQNNFNFNTGGPGCIVVARVMYQWPVWAAGLHLSLGDVGPNSRLLMATAAFRNEPYGAQTGC
jgi:Flp pilus assembly protein TadG